VVADHRLKLGERGDQAAYATMIRAPTAGATVAKANPQNEHWKPSLG
jgi:hypothetical protein